MGGTHSIFLPNRALLRCLGGVFLPVEMEQASSGQDGGLPAAVLASVSPPSTFTPRAGREEPPPKHPKHPANASWICSTTCWQMGEAVGQSPRPWVVAAPARPCGATGTPSLTPSAPVRRGGAEEPPASADLPGGALRPAVPFSYCPGVAGPGAPSRAGRRRP